MIDRIGLFGWHFDLGPLAVPFTLFWLVGAINAVNLLDGMDGLATTATCDILNAFGVRTLGAVVTGSPEEIYYTDSRYEPYIST